MAASADTDSAIVFGLTSLGTLSAWGRSIFTTWVSTGTVRIKMISNTSMTSTSGVMLISLITSSSSSPPPNAMLFFPLGRIQGAHLGARTTALAPRTREEIRMQLMGKAVELAQNLLVPPGQRVVPQHRRNRHYQAEGGHDQRFAHRASYLVDTRLPCHADADQRMIDSPHRTKQPHERRR